MWYIIVILTALLALFYGCRSVITIEPYQNEAKQTSKNISSQAIYSKEDIKAKLQKIRDAQLTKEDTARKLIFAMCYSPSAESEQTPIIAYICPVCGEKTLYSPESVSYESISAFLISDLQKIREKVAQIKGIDINLDERILCKKCRPLATTPAVILNIRLKGETEYRKIAKFNLNDIITLDEALNDRLVHVEDNATKALSKYLPRLEELLGVKLDK